jgi:hypothetical protein
MNDAELDKKQSPILTPETLEEERIELERTWTEPGGIYGFLATTDHKMIGLRTVVTAFIFFTSQEFSLCSCVCSLPSRKTPFSVPTFTINFSPRMVPP